MKTYSFEGTATALTSIMHGSGEKTGIISMLRREKFVQPDGRIARVPVISGNAVRGILRDVGMYDMLQRVGYGVQEDGTVVGLPLPAFYFLFSGGALTSNTVEGLDIEKMRAMRELIPLIGVFGGAVGNQILPGKLKVGKLLPIARETAHLLPEKFRPEEPVSVWDLCQTEFYTRRDDEKNDKVRNLIDPVERKLLGSGETSKGELTGAGAQQMMYRQETFCAGTQFFWKIVLEDPTDLEFESFVQTLIVFSRTPYVGGRSAVGHGELSIKFDGWVEIDSRANLDGKEVDLPLLKKYEEHLKTRKDDIRHLLQTAFK
ncbi:MAG: hypothetical protein D6765_12230 [Bacteroidetes bacterium]|nr:MAG: hypothetical protein D6765_12230 [Bacteroidota bacterium]